MAASGSLARLPSVHPLDPSPLPPTGPLLVPACSCFSYFAWPVFFSIDSSLVLSQIITPSISYILTQVGPDSRCQLVSMPGTGRSPA